MPADDLILNVRQIAQYPVQGSVAPTDLVLLQPAIGQPYYAASTAAFVATALQNGGGPFGVIPTAGGSGPDGLFANWYSVSVSGAFTWNAMGLLVAPGTYGYITGGQGAAKLEFTNGVWNFDAAPPTAGPGTPIAWQTPATLTLQGYLTLADQVLLARDPEASLEAATMGWVAAQIAALSTVSSWNGRVGNVMMNLGDIMAVGGAPLWSPAFQGTPTAPTPSTWNSSNQVATTAFTQAAIISLINNFAGTYPLVNTFNGRTGNIVLTEADILAAGGAPSDYAPINSPAFTGTPTAPTPPSGNNSTQIATTAWVVSEVGSTLGAGFAPIASPAFSGVPTAPTAAQGTSTGQLATTAFVMDAITESTTGVASFNTRTGAVVLIASDLSAAGGALLVSPAFTGSPTGPTASAGTSSTQLATTAFVSAAISAAAGVASFNTRTGAVTLNLTDIMNAGGAPNASPLLTGSPQCPTVPPGTNNQQIASTAFVMTAVADAGGVTTFNSRTGAVTLIANDISAVGGALTTSPAFTGVPTAPTAAPGAATTQIATTAFVMAAISTGNVTSFNTRTGAITLIAADVSAAGGALLNSPNFTGSPTAPTASVGTNTTQLATTAFVQAALAGANIVASFNGRSGAVTLSTADIAGAGGAPINSPQFTGIPQAPTASSGTSTQQVATTAFVANALSAANVVTTFNGRAGAVTLQANDLSAVGGALLASPTFTGTPSGPTAAVGTDTTQLATTAFVINELNTLGGVTSFNGRAGVVTLTAADVAAAGGPYMPFAYWAGGFVNHLRNGGFQNWQRGLTFTGAAIVGGAYYADGWMVSWTGTAPNSIGQVATAGLAGVPFVAFNALNVGVNATGNTVMQVYQRIESVIAGELAGRTVTLSFKLFIGAAAVATTPTLITQFPTAQDNWAANTIDLASTNLQPCAAGTTTQCAITFNVSASAVNGYGIFIRPYPTGQPSGGFNISDIDLRVTPGAPLGLVSAPNVPTPELRPFPIELLYNQRYFSTTGGGLGGLWSGNCNSGGVYFIRYVFPAPMRASPTVVLTSANASGFPATSSPAQGINNFGFTEPRTSNATTTAGSFGSSFTASAEL
jgi:hypothetical protein